MLMAFPWAAAAAGGSGILAPIISGLFNKSAAKKGQAYDKMMLHEQNTRDDKNWQRDNEYAEKVWNMQNQYNEQMWHKMNEYNSPMSQMQRYKEAGLNPHLIYGQSNTSSPIATANFGSGGKTSSNASKGAHVPSYDFSQAGSAVSGALSQYIQMKESGARVNNLEAQNDVLKQDAIRKAVEIQGMGTQNEIAGINRDNLKKYSADMLEADLNKSRTETNVMLNRDQREAIMNASNVREAGERIASMKSQRLTQEQERELRQYDINLRAMGINPSDPTWLRVLTQYLIQSGIIDDAKSTVDKTLNWFKN